MEHKEIIDDIERHVAHLARAHQTTQDVVWRCLFDASEKKIHRREATSSP